MMIQPSTMIASSMARTERRPTIWGLSALELHDAYWRGQGVQVVARGAGVTLERAAELYLLVEPGQTVCFDLRRLIERITWSGAIVTRVRVMEDDGQRYRERIVTGADGVFERIERLYRPRAESSYRVVITRSRRLADIWNQGDRRREAWKRIRREVPYYQIDHWRTQGRCLDARDPNDERALLDHLAAEWSDPHRSIDGVRCLDDGVIVAEETVPMDDAILVGPVWIGRGRTEAGESCFIGPAWYEDDGLADLPPARVRTIREIDPGERAFDEPDPLPTRQARYEAAKRAFDIGVSAAVLLALTPLFVVVGLAVMLTDGRPIFYGHRRQTRGGRVFRCWKFRTMRRDADKLTRELQNMNLCDGPQFYIENDPRVTRVGRFLRRWHLDELPQFWNVLMGDMSIVGPRPSPDAENQFCPAWREIRLSVRPGITGLWQVERTREPGKDFQEWIRFDIEYVQRASFWTDLRICVRTVMKIALRR